MKIKQNKKMLFYSDYIKSYHDTFDMVLLKKIEKIDKLLLKKIKEKKNIFVCGNGGSASVSNHFLCDFNKGIKVDSKRKLKPRVISLANNLEIITAIGNDINYENIFSYQLENYGNNKDLLINFSCSGKSKNIINAAKYAKKNNLDVISIVGFNAKSKLKNYSSIFVNLGVKNYGISEDIFQSIMHMISQSIRREFISKKNKII